MPPPHSPPGDAPSMEPRRRPFPRLHVQRSTGADFGEAVAEAWFSRHGGGRIDIPLGVVAALALWPCKTPGAVHAQSTADFVAAQPAGQWPATVEEVTATYWMRRPDLIGTAAPIFHWSEEKQSPGTLRAIKAVADAALRHGVLEHTGDADPAQRSKVDLLSWTIISLRHRSERESLGEFHTPPAIIETMAIARLGDPPPPQGAMAELTGGTGGMFRSAVQHLRRHRVDPSGWTWHLQDRDPLAAAAACVNFLVWDMGPNSLVSCGDSLSRGDLFDETLAARRELETLRDTTVDAAAIMSSHSAAHGWVERVHQAP